MTVKHVLKMSSISVAFGEHPNLLKSGENAVESGHALNFTFDGELGIIKGKVQSSMRDKVNEVEIELDEDKEIQLMNCSCPVGRVLCHHMAALCIQAHYQISVTDVLAQWSIKKGKGGDVLPLCEINKRDGDPGRMTLRDPTEEENEKFAATLENFGTPVGCRFFTRDEVVVENQVAAHVQDILFSGEYLRAENQSLFLSQMLEISGEKIREIAQATVGQHQNENWLMIRKDRLTASKFGFVLDAINKNRYNLSLFKKLAEQYRLQGVKAIEWGKSHEAEAIKAFEEAYGHKVNATGIWLHPCGFLGASPDGFVGDEATIEVKCPYQYRNSLLEEELQRNKKYILSVEEDGSLKVNPEHHYFQQIQGTLALTGRKVCHLIIWTPNQILVTQIEAEEDWLDNNFEKLRNFYLEKYIKYVMGYLTFEK